MRGERETKEIQRGRVGGVETMNKKEKKSQLNESERERGGERKKANKIT